MRNSSKKPSAGNQHNSTLCSLFSKTCSDSPFLVLVGLAPVPRVLEDFLLVCKPPAEGFMFKSGSSDPQCFGRPCLATSLSLTLKNSKKHVVPDGFLMVFLSAIVNEQIRSPGCVCVLSFCAHSGSLCCR